MEIDAVFNPVAKLLIDDIFPTSIVYHRDNGSTYDPATGDVTPAVVDYTVNAGVLSSGRRETGGVGEPRQLSLWVKHDAAGLPFLPTTADRVTYLGVDWKVVDVTPTYHSKGLIASKLTVRTT